MRADRNSDFDGLFTYIRDSLYRVLLCFLNIYLTLDVCLDDPAWYNI